MLKTNALVPMLLMSLMFRLGDTGEEHTPLHCMDSHLSLPGGAGGGGGEFVFTFFCPMYRPVD